MTAGFKSLLAIAIAVLVCCLPAVAGCGAQPPQGGSAAMPSVLPMGILGMAHQANEASTTPDGSASIVGFWHVLFTSGGRPFDEGFDVWHSDGTEILNDNVPPQPANGTGNFCLGVYKKTGEGTYKLRHPFWLTDANGNLYATGVLLEDVALDKDGDHYHGSFTEREYDLSGNLIYEAKGTLRAERVTAD